jgi:RNA polymerase sigma factor (sigma-70 family)
MDEARIIMGCRQEEARAQKLLFEKYADAMLLVCVRYVKNHADAEELLLNGFYKFFTQADKFVYNGEGSVAPWLRKIMVNECLMFLRKKGHLILMDEQYAAQLSVEDDAIAKLGASELFEVITELPAGYRTVFNLYVIEEMTHKEIAVALGITEGTSKSQLNKARVALQKIVLSKGGYHERKK